MNCLRALRTALISGLVRDCGIGIELALSSAERGGRSVDWAETDSAANQFGAPESAEDPRGTFPLFVAPVCPSHHDGIYR